MKQENQLNELIFDARERLKEREYWLNQLSGDLVKSSFPFDRIKKAGERRWRETLGYEFTGETFSRLMHISNKSDIRLYLLLMTVVVVLLEKYSGNKDIIVGAPIYQQQVEGDLINKILALRNRLRDDMLFKELLLQVSQTNFEAVEHINYPIETIPFELNMSFQEDEFPLFDVAVLVENIHDRKYIEHLNLNVIFSFLRTDDSVRGVVEYNANLYRKDTMERIVSHYMNLMQRAIFSIDAKISDIPILSETETQQLLFDFNDTRADYPMDRPLHRLFEEQVQRTPHHVALEDKSRVSVTYHQLNQGAHRLAYFLREKGSKTETITALIMDRSIRLVTWIMAVLKSGGAYLPIDIEYPPDRIKYLLEDSDTKLLLTAGDLIDQVEFNGTIIDAEDEGLFRNSAPSAPLNASSGANNLAYVIYTSGTTGKPKGVMLEHRAVVNYVWWAAKTYVRNETLTFPLYSSISFDLTVTSLFTPLVTGNTIIIYAETDKDFLIETIVDENRVEVVKLTPSHLQVIKYKPVAGSNIRCFIVGGEELETRIAREIDTLFGGNVDIYNEYGPTEAAVGCVCYKFNPAADKGRSVPIGVPTDNVNIYLLDTNREPVPVGVQGELYISGDSLARGYLNSVELTAEKFIDFHKSNRSYKSYISTKAYRSGDLARWLPGGNLEYLGRMDQQVKIRGYRIELGEIEQRLLHHDDIKEAVVIARDSRGRSAGNEKGEILLCAYFVSHSDLRVSQLRVYLQEHLPEYMIPLFFVPLEEIPLTSNGKVDRKALPEPELKLEQEYVAPGNEIERKLASIWSEVLEIDKERIGIDANFFELGGQSLKQVVLISRIHRELNVKIPLAQIFESKSIRRLSRYIERAAQVRYISIHPAEKKEYYLTSSAQKRIFFLNTLDNIGTSYNVPFVFKLGGHLDKEKFNHAIHALIRRHESLRTSFVMMGEEPIQRIHPFTAMEFKIEYVDMKEAEVEEKRYHDNRKRLEGTRELAPLSLEPLTHLIKNFIRPFDLSRLPLLRVRLIRTHPEEHILLLDMHHIISDGVTMEIFINEFIPLYGGEEPPLLRLQYKDFAQWQNNELKSQTSKQQEKFWIKEFEAEIPVLNLPIDYPRPALQSFEGATVQFTIGKEETRRLKYRAREEEVTLFMILLAIYNIFISRVSNQEVIIIGTPVAARRHADLDRIIGVFINTLALKNYPRGEIPFKKFLEEVKEKTVAAFSHQEYPYEELVETIAVKRDTGRNPLFDTMFALQNMDTGRVEIPGLKLESYDFEINWAKFDITTAAVEINDEISFALEYSTTLFKRETIERFIGYFKRIVSSVLNDPEIKIYEIDILAPEEKQQLLARLQENRDYPVQTIVELFRQQVRKTPDHVVLQGQIPNKTAAFDEDVSFTYGELNEKSHRLAYRLREQGMNPGMDAIAVILASSLPGMVRGVLATLQSGGAYVLVEPNIPSWRMNYILKDSGSGLLVTDTEDNPGLDREIPLTIVDMKAMTGNLQEYDEPLNPGDTACILYETGAGGFPRGLMMTHQHLVNLVGNMRSQYENQHQWLAALTSTASPAAGQKDLNTDNYCILDSYMNLLPPGTEGEIYMRGDDVSRGYLNCPALTVESFIKNPFPGEGTSFDRLYRTGNKGKYLPGGNLVITGCSNGHEWWEIAGHLVEPDEIRFHLLAYPGIKEAVVVSPNGSKEETLIAYYEKSPGLPGSIDSPGLKQFLSDRLPVYLIPGKFLELEKIPLTSTGQPDLDSLSHLEPASFVGPRTPTEKKLSAVWRKILGEDRINVTADFFQMGGNSIKALMAVQEINDTFDVNLLITDIFEKPTIEKFSQYLDRRSMFTDEEVSTVSPIKAMEQREYYDVSHAQKRLWVICQFAESSLAYNMPMAFILQGNLNEAAFIKAFELLVERHEILRTVFITVNGGPKQKIVDKKTTGFTVEFIEPENHTLDEEQAGELVNREAARVFDLSKGPLLTARLLHLRQEKYLFLFNMHHIISDGWSMGVLMREVSALYNTIVNDHEQPLPLLKIQYKDFSAWQNQQLQGEALRKHREYWYKQFESEVPVLQLPYDFQRPKMKSYNGDILAFTVSPGLSQEVIALGRARDATLFMILLASVKALLYRYSHQEDMIIGSPLSGRQNRQLEDQIGFYVNTLALRTTFKGSDSFAQLLDQVKVVTLAAFDHEVYPFDQLVDDLELRRDTSRSPLFDVMVGLNMDISDIPHQGMEGTHIDGYEVDSRISKYDLLFAFTHLPEGIQVTVEYNSDLFLPQRIQRMAGHYRGLLQAIVKDSQTPLNRLDYLSPAEKHQLLHQFARASTDMPMEKTFNDYLQQQESVEVEQWLNTPGFSRYILDPALNPLPIGVDGDIWIGGPAMSPEDDNLPGDTTGRLIDNPFATDTAEMLFHTGARGRYLEDGHIAVTEKETDPSQQHRQDSEPEMFIEPRTDMEQQIAAAWKKVLGVETIGIHSDFFQIGGNSLKGLTAIQEINETLHLNLLITHIFEHPTVEKFSAYLEDISDSPGLETSRPQSIENIEMREYYDISHAQKRLWVVCQFPESSMAYNMPGGYILSGQLQPDALVKAFELLVERHEILRTIFITVEDKPKQKILSKDKTGFTFDTLDLGKNAHREEQTRQLVNREAWTAFDLNNGPLVRAKLIRLQEDKYLFLFNMHHIISDGWSLGVMIREISVLYNAIVNDHDQPLPLLKIQYKDFTSWQNEQLQGEALNKHRQYWLKQMSQPIPVLELPYDNPRPRVKTFNGDVIGFLLSPGLTSQINQVALAHETSLFITLLASVQALLYRYTGQEDMIVGSPVSGRGHRVLENQVGFYVNMLALRTSFKGSHGFKALLDKVKKTCLAAYEHDVYPFDRLVDDLDLERDMSRSPLFDVLVSLNPEIETLPGETFEKVTLENYTLDPKISKFDLFFAFSQLPEGLYVTIEYNTDLFHRSRIRRMVDHYRLLLDSLVTDVQTPLHELNYLSPSEKHRILVEFNDTRREYPGDGTIAQLFAEEAARSPETVALVGVSASAPTVMHVTYRELEQKSRQLAYWLEANGLCPDMDIIVAIMVERSVEMALGILGILMAGAAYLPIDSEYPRERIRYMLADSDARMLLSQESEIGQVIGQNPPMVLEINKSLAAFTSPLPPSHPQASLTAFSPSAQLAYILYTSGTTGNPKAVMVEQHSVIRLVKNTNFIEFEKGDRILQTGALDFDASTLEIWGSLLNGLQLHLESKDTLLNPHRLKEAVRKHIISTMWMTAPLFNRMVDEDIEIFSGIRNLLVGGDVLSPAHIRQVREKSPILKVINGYGPTENTTFSTTFSIDKDYETNIPIGKPIANSTAYILDKHRQLVPIGVFGELVVGGDGVARGYLNNPELTAEKFVPFFHRSYKSYRSYSLYRTGDLARWLPDGNIDFLGRTDQQVKIRGFRIELAEIENHLVKHDQIKEALVIARQGTAADKYLCAYIVPAKEKELSPLQLRKFLQDRLPGYMIPAYFIFLDGFPLTPNGKIERKALPDPGTEYPGTDVQLAAPRNAVEEKLVEIWAAVLNRNNVGIDDDFFVVGGDSIKAIQVASRMNKASYKVDIKDIYQYPTISELAPIVRPSRQEAKPVDKGPFYPGKGFELTGVLEKLPDRYDFEITDIYPLTPMQEGMLFHSLLAKNNSIYFEQFSYRLHGHLDITLLEKSLNRLFQRYDILRTAFIHQDIDRPVQVVLANRPAEFYFKDICDRTDEEKQNFIRQYKNKDIQRSFDLEKDVLMRVLLIKVKESLYQFTWSFHHILLDGWCIGILTSDFFEFYNSMLESRECRLMPVKPYREYILWLEKQDKKEAERFWEKYLQNYNESAYISAMTQRKATGEEYKDQRFTFALDSETTNQLKQLAGRNRVTVNTVFQVLWGIILAKYTGKQDVVFGAVVSGRPAELEGVETMVGLFINTVPVRIRLEKNAVFKQVLKKVQQETLQCEPFHYYPLARIQAKSPLKQELLDHILVFENFPAAEQIDGLLLQSETGTEKSKTGTLTVSDVEEFGLSNYDFNIIIGQRETTDIIFSYNAHVYERKFVQQIAGHLNKLIEQVLTNHHIEIDDLTILDEKEISQLIKMIRNESDKSFIRDLEQQDGIEAELEANFDF